MEFNYTERIDALWTSFLDRFPTLPPIPPISSKACVLIEPRPHRFLVPVIRNFMTLLAPEGWGLVVVHGTANEAFLEAELGSSETILRMNIGVDTLRREDYNRLLTSTFFWTSLQALGVEHALLFQTDALLRHSRGLDAFLNYDYVGAPWNTTEQIQGGNGGLSLRRVSAIIHCIEVAGPCHPTLNEDLYFSNACKQGILTTPSLELAMRFSCESVLSEDPCGLHRPRFCEFPEDAVLALLTC
jgi:hypothetical protein